MSAPYLAEAPSPSPAASQAAACLRRVYAALRDVRHDTAIAASLISDHNLGGDAVSVLGCIEEERAALEGLARDLTEAIGVEWREPPLREVVALAMGLHPPA